jgi:hypothetical protein
MFTKGAKVECINSNFPKPLVKDYLALPKKGVTYTVREVYVARGIRAPLEGTNAGEGEIGVLLEELRNPIDVRCKYGYELGFKAERFRELEHQVETEYSTKEDEVFA